jgi:hypothetical protein
LGRIPKHKFIFLANFVFLVKICSKNNAVSIDKAILCGNFSSKNSLLAGRINLFFRIIAQTEEILHRILTRSLFSLGEGRFFYFPKAGNKKNLINSGNKKCCQILITWI